MVDEVKLNQRGQQYILGQNDLNNVHFTSLAFIDFIQNT